MDMLHYFFPQKNLYELRITDLDFTLLYIYFGWGIIATVLLFFIDAPYGRFSNNKVRFVPDFLFIQVNGRIGWLVQESPSALVPLYYLIIYYSQMNMYCRIFFGLWLLHYVHRAWIYPLFRSPSFSNSTILTVSIAIYNTTMNGYTNALWILVETTRDSSWLENSPILFVLGIATFFLGYCINFQADQILFNLRKTGNKNFVDSSGKYYIPQGGFFEYVSAANYFGELVEWFGLFLAFRTLPCLVFFLWTGFCLIPRAIAIDRWYRRVFKDKYPENRKAIFPFIL
jgi:3-oxo-5-alpha-steroid 4-dehydrogenase 1